jgi:hypothetical protein
MTEGSLKTSYNSEKIEPMQRQACTDVVRDHTAHDHPPQLLDSCGTLQHYDQVTKAELQEAPTRRGRRTEAQPSARRPGTVRHDLYRRTVELPTVRFAAPETRLSRLSNFSASSIYVQQEQRQRLPVHLGLENNGGYRYSDCYDQKYMSETEVLDHEGFEELSDEQITYGLTEAFDDDVGSLDYVADGMEQLQEAEHTSVVTPGFWRPNRLY